MRCHRSVLSPWHFSLLALLILLASCQGTQFGTAVEDAVAPTMPQPPERLLEPDSSEETEDRVNPDDSLTPDEEPTPNDDNLGNSAPDTSTTEAPDSSDPESLTDPTDPSAESPPDTDDRPTDEDASEEVRRQTRFSDLDVEPPTAAAIAALDNLDVFADIESEDFQPNRSVRRQEFARWTTLAYNALYAGEPDLQLPLADDSETPLFLDVPEDSPDFPYIQALANAGIIEMRADREFEPDKLLSRADLIAIKVALDLGADTLQGTLADVERDWEFFRCVRHSRWRYSSHRLRLYLGRGLEYSPHFRHVAGLRTSGPRHPHSSRSSTVVVWHRGQSALCN